MRLGRELGSATIATSCSHARCGGSDAARSRDRPGPASRVPCLPAGRSVDCPRFRWPVPSSMASGRGSTTESVRGSVAMATMITDECIKLRRAASPSAPTPAIYQGGVEWDALDGARRPASRTRSSTSFRRSAPSASGSTITRRARRCVRSIAACPNPQIPGERRAPARASAGRSTRTRLSARRPVALQGRAATGAAADAAADGRRWGGAAPVADRGRAAPRRGQAGGAGAVIASARSRRRPARRFTAAAAAQTFRGRALDRLRGCARASRPDAARGPSLFARVASACRQPLLGALPASSKARLESAIGNPRSSAPAGSTGLNILLHQIAIPVRWWSSRSSRTGRASTAGCRPWFLGS
jgi:hypothetical protein